MGLGGRQTQGRLSNTARDDEIVRFIGAHLSESRIEVQHLSSSHGSNLVVSRRSRVQVPSLTPRKAPLRLDFLCGPVLRRSDVTSI
jgi:hypothetical protein